MYDLDLEIQEIDEYWEPDYGLGATYNDDYDYNMLRAMKEERDAYDDFIASMDMED